MRALLVAACVFWVVAVGGVEAAAAPRVEARIDISEQRMRVYVNGVSRYTWAVSTGRGRYRTPTGTWRPTFLSRYHRSSRYDNAPMPFSVFFFRGYAVHGTDQVSRLGQPASHGCVRLHPNNASTFFRLVQRYGRASTRITVLP
jgi:lipoprotein-anchoring transpeptidase ErfK/SrfK